MRELVPGICGRTAHRGDHARGFGHSGHRGYDRIQKVGPVPGRIVGSPRRRRGQHAPLHRRTPAMGIKTDEIAAATTPESATPWRAIRRPPRIGLLTRAQLAYSPYNGVAGGPTSFGEFLATSREQGGWSRREIAEAAGISTQFVAYLESGERHPSPDTVERLIMAMDLPPRRAARLRQLGHSTATNRDLDRLAAASPSRRSGAVQAWRAGGC
jgi:transcriptional regulator with XRE-family HTH domain